MALPFRIRRCGLLLVAWVSAIPELASSQRVTAAVRLPPAGLDLAAIRAQYEAFTRLKFTLGWYSRTQGEEPVAALLYLGREPLFSTASLATVDSARRRPGLSANEALALRFLRRALAIEQVKLRVAKFDDQLGAASAAAVIRVSFDSQPIPYLNLPLRLASETDVKRRAELSAAGARVMIETLNPILVRREAAMQEASRAAGYRDYVAMSEELRDVALDSLLLAGVSYVRETDAIFKSAIARIAREELGMGLDSLRLSDFGRMWKSPSVMRLFPRQLQLPALEMFLAGIGLDLKTADGSAIRIDDSLHPKKVPRAFVVPLQAGHDVRLSVKPQDGMDDLATLFHEAGHAVHGGRTTIKPWENTVLGSIGVSEAFGEFFRLSFEDPRFLERYRAFLVAHGQRAPTNAELAAVMRRTTLMQMYYLRRYAFAKSLYELRLHGRPASAVLAATALLPAADRATGEDDASLRELYGQAFSVAYGISLTAEETSRFRSDVDDTFYSADYARAFVLAGMMHQAMRRKFGPDWYANPAVGAFLTRELFSKGTALSFEDVAERIGAPRRIDFAGAARHAKAALFAADSLERAR
jgi:hypothetical protein